MKWKPKNKYVKVGITAFLVVAASLLFYFILFRAASLKSGLSALFAVLNPIIYGFIIAYALNPQMQLIENIILWVVSKTRWHPGRKARGAIRVIATLLSTAIAILVVYGLFSILIPGLIESVQNIIRNFQGYVDNITKWVDQTIKDPAFDSQTNQIITMIADKIEGWFGSSLTPKIDELMAGLTTQVLSIASFVKNVFLGLIISIYILIRKDSIKARFFRIIYALFSITNGNRIIRNLRFIDEKFGGFLIGKLIDSAIIGVIAYFALVIMRMPYPLLIAVVIGVTNIIPFFGPFIGAIPSALLIFAVDPIKAIIFLIFIIVLQQVDGNLIGPAILGNSVGISSFMVLVSIIFFGGVFGVKGMIIGVPVTAILVTIIQNFLIRRLMKKKVDSTIENYRNIEMIDPVTRKPTPRKRNVEKQSLYSRIKTRSKTSVSYDYPLDANPWDRTEETVRTEDELNRQSIEAESKSFLSKGENEPAPAEEDDRSF